MLVVGATGCGGNDLNETAATTTSAAPTQGEPVVTVATTEGEPGDLPTVAGDDGTKPVLTLPEVDPPAELVTEVLTEGTGAEVVAGDTLVAQYVGVTWDDATQFDSSWDRGTPAGFPIGVQAVIPAWDQALVGQRLGSRVLLVVPPELGYGPNGNARAGIAGTDTLVFVVDLVAAFGSTLPADATVAPPDTTGTLPVVAGAPDAKPTVTIPAGVEPPAELVARRLIEGDGATVEAGDTLSVQYVGALWRDGSEFDASWDGGEPVSFPVGVGRLIPAWDQALVGVPAGSRVLLVVPPELGYGAGGNPQAGITGTDTLVFVIDILGAY